MAFSLVSLRLKCNYLIRLEQKQPLERPFLESVRFMMGL
jgi:hypothetical protein